MTIFLCSAIGDESFFLLLSRNSSFSRSSPLVFSHSQNPSVVFFKTNGTEHDSFERFFLTLQVVFSRALSPEYKEFYISDCE